MSVKVIARPSTEVSAVAFGRMLVTAVAHKGTGLGFDIIWRIVVNKHHGDIQVELVPGDTRFRVRLLVSPANTECAYD
jgi:nitrogen-specific signal transduction histidine kinase